MRKPLLLIFLTMVLACLTVSAQKANKKRVYEKEYKWFLDLNDELNATLVALLKKERPIANSQQLMSRSLDWSGQIWTDKHPWQTELSILDTLFDERD